MTLFRTVAAVLILTSTAAVAQTAPAAPPPGAPAAAPGAPLSMNDARTACRTQMDNQGLRGPARQQAMTDCMTQQRPDMAARIKCWRDPGLKGMDKDARKAAMRACVAKAKG